MILGAEPVTRRRRGAQVIGPDGRGVDGADTVDTILASVQPISGRDVQVLEEGTRSSVELKMYTTSEVRSPDQHSGTPADRIEFDGRTFEVVDVERQRSVLPHYKALLQRVSE